MQIRLSGAGGQGVILMGIILADTAIESGYNAIQSQSYGPEARGGASKCEVIISEDDIYYPKVRIPDLLLALTQDSYDKYSTDITDDTLIIVDSSIDINESNNKVYKAPIIHTAVNDIRKPISANIIALGVVVKIIGLFNPDTVLKCILKKVPRGTEKLNENALYAGMGLISETE